MDELEKALGQDRPAGTRTLDWVPAARSSNVAAFAYEPGDGQLGTLHFRFLNGGHYCYLAVPADAYARLLAAPSKGEEHWASVRRKGYACVTITKARAGWRKQP